MQMNKDNPKLSKFIQHSILRVALHKILENMEWTKTISYLAKVNYLHYSNKQNREKKLICIKCKKTFDNILVLILHIQLQHNSQAISAYEVSKYQVLGDTLIISPTDENQKYFEPIYHPDFIVPLPNKACYLFGSFQYRTNVILDQTIKKIFRKQQSTNERLYYHSTDIFRQIGTQSEDEDSQDDIGTVERQLQQLRIRQFTDVNQIDKKFFIQWNAFTHKYKQRYQIIYPQAISDLLKSFATQIAITSPIDVRINLVIHLWTLWSLGQITSQQLSAVTDQYDQTRKLNQIQNRKN